ncbi:MAG: ornithine carbamoyltransferase [Proteobacteria bacterium]|nr:ornithine carbamoyltransferase [Pseudomonadota bacterium]
MPRHLLTMFDFTADEITGLMKRAAELKKMQRAGKRHRPLEGRTLGMVFEKSSTRTRVSFEVGMYQLGGHALNLTTQASQLGRGETYEDTSRVLSRYVDGIMMRTFEQRRIERVASASSVPVINGLSDLVHPCQVLTDMFTVVENTGSIRDRRIAYVGDGNNMANSWINAAIILGFSLSLGCPEGYDPAGMILDKVKDGGYSNIRLVRDPREAVKDADVINTDTWVSMGQEGEGEQEKLKVFRPYQVNAQLLSLAKKDAIVLHCLPAHRGDEITDEVMDGPQSRVFDQAENRLHVQKAILEKLMG